MNDTAREYRVKGLTPHSPGSGLIHCLSLASSNSYFMGNVGTEGNKKMSLSKIFAMWMCVNKNSSFKTRAWRDTINVGNNSLSERG